MIDDETRERWLDLYDAVGVESLPAGWVDWIDGILTRAEKTSTNRNRMGVYAALLQYADENLPKAPASS